jgi:hypothetical protein
MAHHHTPTVNPRVLPFLSQGSFFIAIGINGENGNNSLVTRGTYGLTPLLWDLTPAAWVLSTILVFIALSMVDFILSLFNQRKIVYVISDRNKLHAKAFKGVPHGKTPLIKAGCISTFMFYEPISATGKCFELRHDWCRFFCRRVAG